MKKITDYAELVKAKHALNKTIAPVEDGASMAGSYTSGKQFIRDSVLYSALTSIAAGTAWSSLTLDTDYEVADDVSTQIAAVNQTLTQKDAFIENVLTVENLLKYSLTSGSTNEVNYTVNPDTTISVTTTGTTASARFINLQADLSNLIHGETYILNGCPSGGAIGTYTLYLADGTNDYVDTGNGVQFVYDSNKTYTLRFVVYASVNLPTPIIFKPMIRLASANDPTKPYAMTNQEITNLLPYKTGSIIASEAVTVNSSHVLRFGPVISVHVDFTVGDTAIPAWDTAFLKIPSNILPEGITGTMQNASTVIQSVYDFTNDAAKLGYVTLAMGATGADKGFFSNRNFAANTRYNIGMVFVFPPTM